jgi:translation initiation factor IF-3
LLQKLAEDVTELGYVESSAKQDGRNMIMVLAPHRATKAAAVAANTKAPSARELRAEENEAAEAATAGPAGNPGE